MSDYENHILGAASAPNDAEWLSAQLEEFDRQLRKLNKRTKKSKGGKKKGDKKLKKRLRALEQEHQQLEQLVLFAMCQSQMQAVQPQQQPWWQTAMANSLPKALELATVSVSRLPPKSQTPLALPAARGRN